MSYCTAVSDAGSIAARIQCGVVKSRPVVCIVERSAVSARRTQRQEAAHARITRSEVACARPKLLESRSVEELEVEDTEVLRGLGCPLLAPLTLLPVQRSAVVLIR